MRLHDLFEEYKAMKGECERLKKEFEPIKNAYKEMNIVKKNIEDAVGIPLSTSDMAKKDEKSSPKDAAR